MSTRARLLTRLASAALALAACALLARAAQAGMLQGFAPDGSPLPPNPNPTTLVGWCSIAYAVLAMVASVLRSDNTALPFQLSTATRAAVVACLAVLMSFPVAVQNGIPWSQALLAMLASAATAWMTHGARVAPGATASEAAKQKSLRPPPMPPPADPPAASV